MIQGVVGEGGAGGGGEGGEGGGDRGAGKGNWEKISELARMGMGRQVGTRYKQTNKETEAGDCGNVLSSCRSQ